jgi:hypothetical protein
MCHANEVDILSDEFIWLEYEIREGVVFSQSDCGLKTRLFEV